VTLERSVEDEVATLVARHAEERGGLLPLLHAIQHALGHIPREAIPLISEGLNLSRAEVHGVVSFYHDFRTRPPGKHVVKLCRAESCQARGGPAVELAASERLGVAMGETRADGQVTLEPVYCIGLCAIGPNAIVDGRPVCRIDLGVLDLIAERIAP
jgi:formate dehydrogenase subunit gamma